MRHDENQEDMDIDQGDDEDLALGGEPDMNEQMILEDE
jgi:hypothetical protein